MIVVKPMNILAPVVTLNAGQFLFKGQSSWPAVLSATDLDSENRHLKFTQVYPYSSVGQVLLRQSQTPEDISAWRYSDSNHVFLNEWLWSGISVTS